MRTEGRLKSWNDARGFGFVVAEGGAQDVFVHVSALPQSARRPVAGERLSFEIQRDPDGRLRAVAARYLNPAPPGTPTPVQPRESRRTHGSRDTHTLAAYRKPRAQARRGGLLGWPLALLLATSGGVWLYGQMGGAGYVASAPPAPPSASDLAPASFAAPPAPAARAAAYRCDGRQHCSQMSSCEEATWVLQHCPDTKMDGDRDGIPCEGQLCGH